VRGRPSGARDPSSAWSRSDFGSGELAWSSRPRDPRARNRKGRAAAASARDFEIASADCLTPYLNTGPRAQEDRFASAATSECS